MKKVKAKAGKGTAKKTAKKMVKATKKVARKALKTVSTKAKGLARARKALRRKPAARPAARANVISLAELQAQKTSQQKMAEQPQITDPNVQKIPPQELHENVNLQARPQPFVKFRSGMAGNRHK